MPHIVPQANGSGRVSRSGSSAFANSITFFFIKAFSSYNLVTESIDCVYLILDLPKTNGLRQVEAVLGEVWSGRGKQGKARSGVISCRGAAGKAGTSSLFLFVFKQQTKVVTRVEDKQGGSFAF